MAVAAGRCPAPVAAASVSAGRCCCWMAVRQQSRHWLPPGRGEEARGVGGVTGVPNCPGVEQQMCSGSTDSHKYQLPTLTPSSQTLPNHPPTHPQPTQSNQTHANGNQSDQAQQHSTPSIPPEATLSSPTYIKPKPSLPPYPYPYPTPHPPHLNIHHSGSIDLCQPPPTRRHQPTPGIQHSQHPRVACRHPTRHAPHFHEVSTARGRIKPCASDRE